LSSSTGLVSGSRLSAADPADIRNIRHHRALLPVRGIHLARRTQPRTFRQP
jgi:hypothetical protein